MNNCKSCSFRNPKGTATAIVMKDGKMIFVKRNEEPYAGTWDIPGGYMNELETAEEAIKREVREELGVECKTTYIKDFPGTASYEDSEFPIISHVFLIELEGDITLNDENSEYKYFGLDELMVDDIAYDSNKAIYLWVQDHFKFDITRVKELVSQLDKSALVNEYSLYHAVLEGYVSRVYDGQKLIGMGWIFPRQTALRKQAVVEDMIVDEAYRGKGLGKTLILNLIQWAKQNGIEVIELTSGSHRIPANELYKKVGFVLHPTNHYLLKL